MPTPVKPDLYARKRGFNHIDFVEAVKNGESEYSGVPIGDWRQEGGQFLLIPDEHADRLGIDGVFGRSNPSASAGKEIAAEVQKNTKSAGVAAAEAAPPVSANVGAAYAAGQFAETVKEQPQVMEDVADTAGFLGSLAFGYATGDGDVVKSGLMAALAFGAFKGARASANQADRRMDMQERQQRHQIQQDRQRQMLDNQEPKGVKTGMITS